MRYKVTPDMGLGRVRCHVPHTQFNAYTHVSDGLLSTAAAQEVRRAGVPTCGS